MLTHLDLFSGIGGFALAAEWAGIETIGFVEIDKYCRRVLGKHWPDVPIVEDIRNVQAITEIATNTTRTRFPDGRRTSLATSGEPEPKSQRCDSTRDWVQSGTIPVSENHNGKPALLITAGFPCQPFSVAGKQLSQGDDRYLWPQTFAVIKAIKPKWILLENVTGIINLALNTVLSDLEGADYSYETLIIPACAVNAPHRRDRVWIVANSRCRKQGECGNTNEVLNGRQGKEKSTNQTSRPSSILPNSEQPTSRGGRLSGDIGDSEWGDTKAKREGIQPTDRATCANNIEQSSQAVADTQYSSPTRQRRYSRQIYGITESEGFDINSSKDWWAVEPELGRVAHGIPHRVDRLKCLGNAIVPQVAYQILEVIAEIESEHEHNTVLPRA